MRVPLFGKLLAAFLALSLAPLVWFGVDASRRIERLGREDVDRAGMALDEKARQALEIQALGLAEQVARFLEERVQDVRTLAALPKRPGAFGALARARTGVLWRRRLDDRGRPVAARDRVPVYAEIAWVGPDGRERFRLDRGEPVPPWTLRDVSRPEGTTFGVERYFAEAVALPPGEPWVGHLVGRHVSRPEQLAGADSVEAAVGGAEYDGHIRFALAVWDAGRLSGVVAAAVDQRHLQEFSQHVLPLSRERVVFPSYRSGNYAFLFDDRGWIIAHPKLWDLPGLGPDGEWIPPYTESSSPEAVALGRIPFRLDLAGFVHPNYPLVLDEVRAGRSGVTRTFNVAGVDKVMAYAPIPFGYGPYRERGVFGGVTVGARTEAFHEAAAEVAGAIRGASRETLRTGLLLAWCLGLVVLLASLGLSRAVSHPVRTMAFLARRIAGGDLDARVEVKGRDELADLAGDLNRMARLLGDKERSLRESVEALRDSRDHARAYAQRLEEQLRTLNHLQSISEFLGTTFDREAALRIILDTCVGGLGFDRAVLYLLDPERGDQLRCGGVAGFDPVEEVRLRQRPFALDRHDCLPVRVVRSGVAARVADVASDPRATPLDRRLARAAGTSSLVFVPMKIRDNVVGVLGADNARSGRPIPEHRVGALQIAAGQAARAVERARLYDEALQARRFIEAVVDALGSGLLTLDGGGRVLRVNPYALHTLGLRRHPDPGTPVDALGLDADLVAWVRTMLDGAPAEPREFPVRVGGEPREFVWVPSRFETAGEPGLILQFRDVTREKRLRRTWERMDRLASLGRMAAGVAHEVRNPLTGVALLLDDLHDRLAGEADRALVARALGELERLEGIVQELLDYARVDRGHKRRCDAAEVVRSSLFLVQKAARSQGVDVVVAVADAAGPVLADPDKLKQALLNLYLNALQAMPDGGRLRVAVEEVGDRVRIRVEDTGTGIPAGELDRIFEPFYSLRPGGSGLGLSIAHTIAEDHGGRLDVVSAPGEGARFTLDLPRRTGG